MLGWVRSIAVAVRDRSDRARHPERRRAALRTVRRVRPSHVLFVCLGNVCRSPFAEALATNRGMSADSVGFIGPGRHPPHEALEAARRLGVDHGGHVSRQITDDDVEKADLIIVFDRFNVRRMADSHPAALPKTLWLGDLDPEWTGKRAVIDPWGRGDAFFDTTFERIARCVDELRSAAESE